jgi:4-hydroxy-tetrahydrodipicolinate reductase
MTSPLRICVSGALGGVGRCLVEAIARDPAYMLTGAVARREAGRDAGEAIGIDAVGVTLTTDLEEALAAGADALIDYTHPDVIREHLRVAFARRVPVVIGTTGMTSADFAEIDAEARRAGVGAATGNFAITAALLQHLAKIAAGVVPHWEVLELNPATKPDVPSGTARELAEVLGEIRPPEVALGDDELIGPVAARGAVFGGARVHSVRLPGCSPWVEVIFGLDGERLVIRHDQQPGGRIFVTGSLLAARRIQDTPGLVRGLDTLLFGDGE